MMMHVRPIEKWQNSPPLKYSNRCGTIYNLYGKITHGLLPWALKKYLVAAAHAAIQVCGVWLPWSTVVRCRVTKVYWQSFSLTWIWFVLAYCCRLSNESSLPTGLFPMGSLKSFHPYNGNVLASLWYRKCTKFCTWKVITALDTGTSQWHVAAKPPWSAWYLYKIFPHVLIHAIEWVVGCSDDINHIVCPVTWWQFWLVTTSHWLDYGCSAILPRHLTATGVAHQLPA